MPVNRFGYHPFAAVIAGVVCCADDGADAVLDGGSGVETSADVQLSSSTWSEYLANSAAVGAAVCSCIGDDVDCGQRRVDDLERHRACAETAGLADIWREVIECQSPGVAAAAECYVAASCTEMGPCAALVTDAVVLCAEWAEALPDFDDCE